MKWKCPKCGGDGEPDCCGLMSNSDDLFADDYLYCNDCGHIGQSVTFVDDSKEMEAAA